MRFLAEKDWLNAALPEAVYVEEADTRASQTELLDLLVVYLTEHHPDFYRRKANEIHIAEGGAGKQRSAGAAFDLADRAGRRVRLDDPVTSPLLTAASLVADDLVLMRRGEDGWRLAAASLCFPSSWTLSEKFGRPLQEIHDPVPGFGSGTRMAEVVARIFDNLPAGQPVLRWNWSLQRDLTLYKPLSSSERDERAEAKPAQFAQGLASAFIRVERQTLRKLPVSGDLVFTIGIQIDPMEAIARQPDAGRVALLLADQLDGLDAAQLAYKGLAADRDRLAADLRAMARQPNGAIPISSLL